MKYRFAFVLALGLTVSFAGRGIPAVITADPEFGNLPLYFIENKGQADRRVSYSVQGRDTAVYLRSGGLAFVLSGPAGGPSPPWVLKLDFAGANRGVKPVGVEKTPAVVSYFKGPREQWRTGLPTYSSVVYRDLWPGIDLVFAGTVNKMESTFVVRPGADPQRIRLAYRGASSVERNGSGELVITAPGRSLRDERPYAYQETDGQRAEVPVAYAVTGKSRAGAIGYGFSVGAYDKRKPLVIDPVMLFYCGYIGGGGTDSGFGAHIAVDDAGNAYLTGTVNSTEATLPVLVGPDMTFNGDIDAIVAKVNPAGTALIYLGYIGGAGMDVGHGIAVDGAGAVYIVGQTTSDEITFPATVGPDSTYNGGGVDAFIAKVNPAGAALE